MKKIIFYLFSIALLILFAGITMAACKKYNDSHYPDYKTMDVTDTIQLLTAAPWKLLSYGYDYNADGAIDTTEENIDDCKKTNVYVFNKNGTGTVTKNETICGNDTDAGIFSWAFTDNKTILDFIYGTASVSKIDQNKMVLTDINGEPVKLITIYGH